ncbi:MAG: NUDIX domain-containing protein [bacterium]|nr:NUDIX domain-containing protein [bacterium]
MSTNNGIVKVGLGVIIENNDQILIGKRVGQHAPYYSIPGGTLEPGETFEQGAIREIKEETNLDIVDPEVIAVTNNLETFKKESVHYISIILLVKSFKGELKIMEPDKITKWQWVDPKNLSQPHFDGSSQGVQCYLDKVFYHK